MEWFLPFLAEAGAGGTAAFFPGREQGDVNQLSHREAGRLKRRLQGLHRLQVSNVGCLDDVL